MREEQKIRERLSQGNRRWQQRTDEQAARRLDTARNGQRPYAIVIACADSRVIPEQIFDTGLGELFVIRVAGNVLDQHQLGSVEYAAGHLDCRKIVLLGHTGCGAVEAALHGGGDGFIRYITDEILFAVGEERDPLRACEKNVEYGVEILRREFAAHPEIASEDLEILGAVYELETGAVHWL